MKTAEEAAEAKVADDAAIGKATEEVVAGKATEEAVAAKAAEDVQEATQVIQEPASNTTQDRAAVVPKAEEKAGKHNSRGKYSPCKKGRCR